MLAKIQTTYLNGVDMYKQLLFFLFGLIPHLSRHIRHLLFRPLVAGQYMVVVVMFFQSCSVLAWQGDVVKVLDGDSIRVRKNNEIIEIRLYGIDCPEWKQDYGNRAKRFTKARLLHKNVGVEPRDVDRYDRIVSLVTHDGHLINRELVANGLAWVYTKYCREEPLCTELHSLEQEARKQRRGLWKDKNAMSPSQWKRKNKGTHSRRHHRNYRYPRPK